MSYQQFDVVLVSVYGYVEAVAIQQTAKSFGLAATPPMVTGLHSGCYAFATIPDHGWTLEQDNRILRFCKWLRDNDELPIASWCHVMHGTGPWSADIKDSEWIDRPYGMTEEEYAERLKEIEE